MKRIYKKYLNDKNTELVLDKIRENKLNRII